MLTVIGSVLPKSGRNGQAPGDHAAGRPMRAASRLEIRTPRWTQTLFDGSRSEAHSFCEGLTCRSPGHDYPVTFSRWAGIVVGEACPGIMTRSGRLNREPNPNVSVSHRRIVSAPTNSA